MCLLPKGIHSHEEAKILAYLMSALGMPTSVESIFECQRRGDEHMLLDAVLRVVTPDNKNLDIGLEYDGEHWHTVSTLTRDVEKTRRVIETYPELTCTGATRKRAGTARILRSPLCHCT